MGQLGRFRQPTGILTSHLDGDHLYLDEDNLYLDEDTTDDDLVFARLDNDDKEEGSAGQPEAPSILTSHLPGHAHQLQQLNITKNFIISVNIVKHCEDHRIEHGKRGVIN